MPVGFNAQSERRAPLDSPSALLNEALNATSAAAYARGFRVLQGCRFGPTDEAHVAVLLGFMAAPPGAVVLDVGCGFGEVARLMRQARPDLSFVLLNRNALQMGYAPRGEGFRQVLGDMHDMPLPAASVDGAMFLYSLCHADQPVALTEAACVVRPGGFLFVYDYERLAGDNALMERALCARAHRHAELLAVCEAAGWRAKFYLAPSSDDAVMRSLFAEDLPLYEAIFGELRPVVWKFILESSAA